VNLRKIDFISAAFSGICIDVASRPTSRRSQKEDVPACALTSASAFDGFRPCGMPVTGQLTQFWRVLRKKTGCEGESNE
jgi:hypothetical protein